jgi:hypothetical protein
MSQSRDKLKRLNKYISIELNELSSFKVYLIGLDEKKRIEYISALISNDKKSIVEAFMGPLVKSLKFDVDEISELDKISDDFSSSIAADKWKESIIQKMISLLLTDKNDKQLPLDKRKYILERALSLIPNEKIDQHEKKKILKLIDPQVEKNIFLEKNKLLHNAALEKKVEHLMSEDAIHLSTKLDVLYDIYKECVQIIETKDSKKIPDGTELDKLNKLKNSTLENLKNILNVNEEKSIPLLMDERTFRKKTDPYYIPHIVTARLTGLPDIKKQTKNKFKQIVIQGLAHSRGKIKAVTRQAKEDDKKFTALFYTPEQRDKYRVTISPDRKSSVLKQYDPNSYSFANCDTSDMISHTKKGYGAFVISNEGEVLIFNHHGGLDQLFHSSYTESKPVLFAGEIMVKNGVIAEITNYSGHYQPTIENIYEAIKFFKMNGINIDEIKIKLLDTKITINAKELYEHFSRLEEKIVMPLKKQLFTLKENIDSIRKNVNFIEFATKDENNEYQQALKCINELESSLYSLHSLDEKYSYIKPLKEQLNKNCYRDAETIRNEIKRLQLYCSSFVAKLNERNVYYSEQKKQFAEDKYDSKTINNNILNIVECGDLKLLQILIQQLAYKFDFNMIDEKNGKSLLHIAVENNHPTLVDFLLENKVDVNKQDYLGQTPLHLAVYHKNVHIINVLCKNNSDPFVKNNKLVTCFNLAIENGVDKKIHLFKRDINVNYFEEMIEKQLICISQNLTKNIDLNNRFSKIIHSSEKDKAPLIHDLFKEYKISDEKIKNKMKKIEILLSAQHIIRYVPDKKDALTRLNGLTVEARKIKPVGIFSSTVSLVFKPPKSTTLKCIEKIIHEVDKPVSLSDTHKKKL